MKNINDLHKLSGVISNYALGQKTLQYGDFKEQNKVQVIKDLSEKRNLTPEQIKVAGYYCNWKAGDISKSEYDKLVEELKDKI